MGRLYSRSHDVRGNATCLSISFKKKFLARIEKKTDYNGFGGAKLFLNNGHALSGTTNHERIHLVLKFFHIKIYRP